MEDVRKLAEERALRPRTAPVGSSFESEHKRQKQALVRQIDSLDGSGIKKIAATTEAESDNRILRVAAYCRVSTDDLDQAISITLQINAYKKMITENPNWKYVGTYVDDGFSGTNTEHRQGLQKLIRDAMDGKIDRIITKSVSRLARNLLDCLGLVEQLQNLDPPVSVFFEQENLDTLVPTTGIILVVLAMVAQEESHMKSEAILLSLEWRFSRGRFMTPRLFGYDKVEIPDGYGSHRKVLQINESEANVVRWMYYSILNGASPEEIAEVLTELAIPTGGRKKDGSFNTHWLPARVVQCLRNEKHCGDVLARKTYTTDFKTHKVRKNNGKKNKYFKADHHDAIVSRTVWNAAQRILNSRKYGHEGSYLPMRIIDTGSLAGFISMNRAWAGFDLEDYYHASQIAMGILEEPLETDLEKVYMPEGRRFGGLLDDHGISQIARDLTEAEREIKDEMEGRSAEEKEIRKREEATKTFQVVSGDMFSRTTDPLLRISQTTIGFNSRCISRMNCQHAELLFNPVERMIIVRPCAEDNPNAMNWSSKPIAASCLSRLFYELMSWDEDYSYRLPCQVIYSPTGAECVLAFDMDNYVGRAINKRDEVIVARKAEEEKMEKETGSSYFFPPEEDDEPQEIRDIEERFQKAVETNMKTFGTPAFQHSSDLRGFTQSNEEWDLMTPAKPLDVRHTVEEQKVDALLSEIKENPPEIPKMKELIDIANTDVIIETEDAQISPDADP